jgi:RNA polymerase sigma-70 factor, ECF subfamily
MPGRGRGKARFGVVQGAVHGAATGRRGLGCSAGVLEFLSVMVNNQAHDPALIRRAQTGDADAVAELYHRHAPVIFRYLYVRLCERATAEDLTGEVFLKMVEGLPHYSDRGLPFGAWLFRIAHARLVDHYRRNNRRQNTLLSETWADEGDGPEALALDRITYRTLLALLRHLTDEQQLVVQLRFIEGHSLEVTASLMQKNVGAVKALQHRALRELERQLEVVQ